MTLLGLLPIIGSPILYFLQGSPIFSDRIIAGWILPGVVSITAGALGTYSFLKYIQTVRIPWLALTIVSFWSLFLAGGKAGAMATPIALLLILVVTRRLRLITHMAVVIAIAAFFLMSNWSSMADMDVGLISHTQTLHGKRGNFNTMYGRFDLMGRRIAVIGELLCRLLFGHGYTAARISGVSSMSGLWTTTHAHKISSFRPSSIRADRRVSLLCLHPEPHRAGLTPAGTTIERGARGRSRRDVRPAGGQHHGRCFWRPASISASI
jgi:hypothetical protein